MADSLPFSQLLNVLTNLAKVKSSGTLFIHSDTNHVITFALDKGRIVAMYHGPKRGRKAIAPISNTVSGTYRFESTGLSGVNQDLPSTPEILNLLRTPQAASEAKAAVAAAKANASGISVEDQDKICRELKNLLAEHLGPIAGMVFDEALGGAGGFCSTPERTQDFINKLADDIDDPAEAAEFREKANEALSRMLGQH